MYQVEVVWNREFDWSLYGEPQPTVEAAIRVAQDIMNSGDGARVKKARIVDEEGNVVVPYVSY